MTGTDWKDQTHGRALVSPSILSADFAHLADSCRAVLDGGADMLHIDVMDGQFVPNISIGVPVVQSLRRALADVFFDVHLMVVTPLDYVGVFARAGASLISFHAEAFSPIGKTIDAIHEAGCQAGLVIKPGTPPEALFPYLEQLELVLVMSVEPGFGGQAFQPGALEKLRILRAEALRRGLDDLLIEVDGGISAANSREVIEAGANVLVAGSAVFGAADPAAAVRAVGCR